MMLAYYLMGLLLTFFGGHKRRRKHGKHNR